MAKMEDVITQLQAVLPKFNDKFSEKFSVSSVVSLGGGIFEIETATVHGLATGNAVNIRNILMVNPITGVSIDSGIVTATTTVKHDLTEDFPPKAKLNISGFTNVPDAEYDLIDVPLGDTFTFDFASLPTGPGQLNEDRIDGVNGTFSITVTSTTKFTISAPDSAFTDFLIQSTSEVESCIRISGAADASRIVNYYSKQEIDNFWAFVVNGPTTVSHDRNIQSDANTRISRRDELRFECIHPFSIYVIAPDIDNFSGRKIADEMIDIRSALCRSICGAEFDSGFSEDKRFLTTFNGDSFFEYVGAYYMHQFDFETVYNFNPDDGVDLPDSRAFRDFTINLKLPFDGFSDIKKVIEGELP